MNKKDYEWFIKVDLSKYKGKYITISGRKILTSGTNAEKVWKSAKAKYPKKKIVLAKIPEEETLVLVFL